VGVRVGDGTGAGTAEREGTGAVPTKTACAGKGVNWVGLKDGTGTIHELTLSSQDETGLKIPPGQILGGPIQVSAGQSVDLNIDFNACASIIQQGNGKYRLKPTLTAGQVSPNNSGISGQIVDSLTKAPITGPVLVAIERTDNTGTDRILMEASTDATGISAFALCHPARLISLRSRCQIIFRTTRRRY
jgi:hypothetical protein